MNFIDTIIAAVISSLLVVLPTPPSTTNGVILTSESEVQSGESLVYEVRRALENWKQEHHARDIRSVADDSSNRSDEAKEADDDQGGESSQRGKANGEERMKTEKSISVDTSERVSSEKKRHDDDDDEDADEYEDDSDEDDEYTGTMAARSIVPVAPIAPRASVQNSVSAKTFTLADVKTHNSAANCYTVVHGTVYDVSAWITKHPGGQSAIKGMCGMDATASFDGQHGGSARPESELAQFKIGLLAR